MIIKDIIDLDLEEYTNYGYFVLNSEDFQKFLIDYVYSCLEEFINIIDLILDYKIEE